MSEIEHALKLAQLVIETKQDKTELIALFEKHWDKLPKDDRDKIRKIKERKPNR